jgi:acetylornithine deacetylase/succinyl-diaminopimelate desuccinylase-like protein
MSQINWQAVGDEVTGYLRDLVRFNTTNPPGNETPCARYIADVLAKEGIAAEVVESAPGRGSVVARLQATTGDSAPPLLLLSHLDVVPADPSRWEHPPFSADLVDGYVWGRGSVDTKDLTSTELMVVLLLQRLGLPLKRDIILAATADEETGGEQGAGWLATHRPELINAAWCINEGGGTGILIGGQRFYSCQTGEKGICWMRWRAKGTAGHASVPRDDNAVVKLSRALARIGEADLPLHRTATVDAYLQGIMGALNLPMSLDDLMGLATSRASLRQVLPDPDLADRLYAMLHNTATPTVLRAGEKTNVIPSVAEAQVDGRLLPGQTKEGFLGEIKAALGEDDFNALEIEPFNVTSPLESPSASELFDVIQQTLPAHDPEGTVLPTMSTGGTDAKHLVPLGMRVYGFGPQKDEPEASLTKMAHADNERISVNNLLFGTQVLFDVVRRFCGA